jgi:hypothetical protein
VVEEVEVEGRVITAFLHPCLQSRLPGAKALRGHAGVQRSGGDGLHMQWAGFREKLGENLTFHIAWPNRLRTENDTLRFVAICRRAFETRPGVLKDEWSATSVVL